MDYNSLLRLKRNLYYCMLAYVRNPDAVNGEKLYPQKRMTNLLRYERKTFASWANLIKM